MIQEGDVYIDDFKLQDLGVIVTLDSQEPALPSIRGSSITIPGKPGAYDFGATLGVKTFEFACIFESDSYTHMKQQIQELKKMLLDQNGRPKQVKLMLGDENDRYYDVRIDAEITVARKGLYGYFPLVLTSFDSHAWSTLSNQDVFWGSEHIYFSNNTYTFGHSASAPDITGNGGEFNVVVVGDNVRPVITLVGVGNNVAVAWDGKLFSLGTINGTVIVDLHEYVVLRNGTFALSTISGDWLSMYLTHGSTNINVTGSDLDLTINVEFHDRFF